MPKLKLTKTAIDRVAKPGTGTVIYFDFETKGFGLRVTASGAASFIVQGVVSGTSKEARLTIGAYGIFTVEQARDVAREHLRNLRMGVDPRDVKKQDEALKVTLRQLADDYISRPGKLKDSSVATVERHVVTTFKDWENLPIVSITEDMCRTRYKEMAEKGLDGKREGKGGSPGQANQGFDILRALLNYAARQFRRADGKPLIQQNPTEVLGDHRVKLKPRSARYVPKDKVGAVWHLLTTARAEAVLETERTSVDLIMFLLLTGARIDEAASLEWSNVQIVDAASECRWRITDRKRGEDVWMPLSSQAVAILKRRPKVKDSSYVFASGTKYGYMDQPRGTLEKVSKVAGQHLSAHDMRRSFTNIAIGVCRIGKFETDLLTGHKPKSEDVTASHYLEINNLTWLHSESVTGLTARARLKRRKRKGATWCRCHGARDARFSR
jgi:integrase